MLHEPSSVTISGQIIILDYLDHSLIAELLTDVYHFTILRALHQATGVRLVALKCI